MAPRPPPSPQLPLLPRPGPTSPSGPTGGFRRAGDNGVPVIVVAASTATSSMSSTSSSSSSSSSSMAGVDGPMLLLSARGDSEDALESVTVDDGTDGGSSYSVCSMKTVAVSSLLAPSPCFVALILLGPPAIGLVLFAFVQHFVPVLVDLLMAM